MRVLMTTDTVGGVWTYAIDLCRGLAELGVEVVLAAIGPRIRETQRTTAASLPGLELHFFAGQLEWMQDPWADVDASMRWLEDLVVRVGADLLHANTFCHAACDVEVPRLVVGHSCVLSWFEAVKARAAPRRFDTYRQRVAHALQAADAVVAPTATMLAALRRHYGRFASSTVVFNGRDLAGFTPAPKRPWIFAAGRLWDEAKNAAVIADAATRWPWPVYLAGDPRSPEGDAVALTEVGLLGHLESADVLRWMASSSIFVAPARYEPFGLGVLEAAASGCALVLGAIPSLYEVWGADAVFVSPDDPAHLARAVENLIYDDDRRTRLAEAARRRAMRFDHHGMASAYHGLYRHVLRAGSAERATNPPSTPRRDLYECVS